MYANSLYTDMAGLQAITETMQAAASNIANSQTTGYEAVQAVTQAQFYQGSNAPVGADAMSQTIGPDAQAGALQKTGDPLDVAISGNAWLQVQTASGVALTRDGALMISSSGLLTNSSGNPILGVNGTPISVPPLSKLEIGNDGTISGVFANGGTEQARVFGQIGLVSTPVKTMQSLGGSLYQPAASDTLSPSKDGALHQGYLNASNVNITEAMMEMIDSSRSYEMQTEMLKNQTSSSQDLNNLLAQG